MRPRLALLYVLVALALLALSALGHARLLGEVGETFGGFFWSLDSDRRIVIVSVVPQASALDGAVSSLLHQDYIVAVQIHDPADPARLLTYRGPSALSDVYRRISPGASVTYTIANQQSGAQLRITQPALTFTWEMWWEQYGFGLLAGLTWLLAGALLLLSARDWSGAVEGITLLPPAMLFLLYSHCGNVQQALAPDPVFLFLWVPSFALLGAAFIQLSLTYRPEAMSAPRSFRFQIDVLPYLPLLALLAFEVAALLLYGAVPTAPALLLSLGYGVLGGLLSLGIGAVSLLRSAGLLPGARIPEHVRRRLGDLLTLWIGGVGLGFCLGVLPILLTGSVLVPLPMFYALALLYPLLLWYAVRSLRLIERLQITLAEREDALREQQALADELGQANQELQRATSLLLSADAHLRSLLSQRIHDQPRQQALRIRSLLGYWQHRLKVEAEHDPHERVAARPLIEALGRVRRISEELEGDLRGLQLLVEDDYQRRSLGLRLHLEKLIREDLPGLHPESPLKVQADLWALDLLESGQERTEEHEKAAEAISYAVTQALLNVYNHAGATFATVRALQANDMLEIYIIDDGRGFDIDAVPPEKTSLFKARLKVREAGGSLSIHSLPRPQAQHGTTIILRFPLARAGQAPGTQDVNGPAPVAEI